jgi:hypothetical protein
MEWRRWMPAASLRPGPSQRYLKFSDEEGIGKTCLSQRHKDAKEKRIVISNEEGDLS